MVIYLYNIYDNFWTGKYKWLSYKYNFVKFLGETVFGPSGNQATIPREETVTFAVVIVIAETFVPDLQNESSPAFKNMTRRFLNFLIPLYRNRTGFLGIIFISFSRGSVVADIELLYNSSEPIPTVEDVRLLIAEAKGLAPFSISSFQVTKKGESQDGFEAWKIVVTVCLAFVFLLLIFISAVVSISFTLGRLNGDSNSAPLFAQLKLLDIFKVNTLQIAKFMFLYHHRLLPVSLSNLFLTNNQVHRYETRNANFYRPHVCRTKWTDEI
jgi:hypothetical protein